MFLRFQYDGSRQRERRMSRPEDYRGMQRSGSESLLRPDLDQRKETIKSEIRRQLKIKEGAENLKKVSTDKKSLAKCNNILKESTAKLQELHDELQDLNAYFMDDTPCKLFCLAINCYVHHKQMSYYIGRYTYKLSFMCFQKYSPPTYTLWVWAENSTLKFSSKTSCSKSYPVQFFVTDTLLIADYNYFALNSLY